MSCLNPPAVINTHHYAADILDAFECMLDNYNITVPSDEDDEREPDNCARLYGSTYYQLMDDIEAILVDMLEKHRPDTKIVYGVF